jgi:hypothetical protein
MAILPTTNLSLNDIHVEVGGSSGTQVSLNDADVRGISPVNATYAPSGISQTSGTSISMGLFRLAGVNPINLRGTSGSPITYFDNVSVLGAPFSGAFAGLRFQTDGDLVKYSNSTQLDTTEWYNGTVSGSFWVRASNSGTPSLKQVNGGSASPNVGAALGTWHSLSSEREFYSIAQSSSTAPSEGEVDKVLKVEIASDSSGTNILGTGYYRIRANSKYGF